MADVSQDLQKETHLLRASLLKKLSKQINQISKLKT